ncbi:flagellar hook protein FlgE [Photobacterium arenosum]|uniref:flagellar hook protein FlgE n=1 Tax=Photobacterium arenosum TaxID=2774143 RepID=UPI00288B618A|nr:flagellar hook protein FlgE [Photobacterium arenosum]
MSFDIALSGLGATNTQLNTISNNIANVSTTGFKESRTEFSSVYNGIQAGGVEVAAISQNFDKNGTVSGTGRSLDLAIGGNGFFVTKDTSGQVVYTRSGVFNTDKDNNIISNTGMKLQGYTVDGNNNLQSGSVGDLQIKTASLAAKATDRVDFVANFDSRVNTPAVAPFNMGDHDTYNSSYTTKVYDSLGNPHTMTQYFVKTGANAWDIHVSVDGAAPGAPQAATFNTDGTLATPAAPFNIAFNPAGADPMSVDIDLLGTTQFGADFGTSTNNPNGYSSGELTGVRVEDNGMVYATYTNGQSLLQGQVMLADFANPQALVKVSNTGWQQSFGSGAPITGQPGSGILGSLSPGALEGSNVDLTSELVNLMTAQRNYQANAKTISTTEQLTQALFNAI